ncbi:MAG: hypothetical protein ACXWXO_06360 [Nocardioides sp.]
MPSARIGLRRVLLRALFVPVLVLLAVAGYVLTAGALAVSTATDGFSQDRPEVASPWKASYSKRYPGCVAAVLWPERSTPVAVVVRWSGGEVERIRIDRTSRRGLTSDALAKADIIGACYRR